MYVHVKVCNVGKGEWRTAVWVGIFEPREELVPWLTYEKAKKPVKSSPSLGPTFPTYINLHTYAYISHVYMCTCMECTLLTRGQPRWLRSSTCNEKVGGNLARALGVKMIYVIRLIKRLSAR